MKTHLLRGFILLLCVVSLSWAAPSVLNPPVDPVVGKWVWISAGVGQIVTLEADGTASNSKGFKGTWRTQPGTPADQHKYRVLWQEGLYLDLATLVAPDRLEGRTNKNEQIIATRALVLTPKPPAPGDKPDPLLGKWIWQKMKDTVTVTINADGTATDSLGYRAVWEYQPEKFADSRRYVFVWAQGLYVDTIKLTAPDKLEGRTKRGDQVLNERVLGRRAPTE